MAARYNLLAPLGLVASGVERGDPLSKTLSLFSNILLDGRRFLGRYLGFDAIACLLARQRFVRRDLILR